MCTKFQNDFKITATAVGDKDRTEKVNDVEYTYSGAGTSTSATAVGLEVTGGSMVAEVGGRRDYKDKYRLGRR